MSYDFHYAHGLRGKYSLAGIGRVDNKGDFIRTHEVISRFFDINQNTNYIDELTVKAIILALEAHYEECYLKLKANEAIKNNFYKPETLYLKNEEIVWVYLPYRSSVSGLEDSILYYKELLIPENRALFFNYCMPNDIFKKYREVLLHLYKNAPVAVDSLEVNTIYELLYWELITTKDGLVYYTDRTLQRFQTYS